MDLLTWNILTISSLAIATILTATFVSKIAPQMNIKVKHSGIVTLKKIADSKRGDIYVAEMMKEIPFLIRRVYFINNFKLGGVPHGYHAHKSLNQVFVCANGSFVLSLDDGKNKQKLTLKDPSVGIVVESKLWHSISEFSKDCVVLVFADEHYNEDDYIRDYAEFQKFIKRK